MAPDFTVLNYLQVLKSKGATEKVLDEIVTALQNEQDRRKNLGVQSVERASIISKSYTPKHPHLYTLKVCKNFQYCLDKLDAITSPL